jgi:inner membrane protein
MDNLTHSLVGATIANAGLKQRLGRGTTLILIVTSNIPDLDVFGGFFLGSESFLYRRMLTHSIIGIPLLALICAGLFRLVFRHLSLSTTFGLSLLGASLHVFFDLVNSFGVVLLYPFSRTRFELAWIFIIDLFIWGLLLVPLIVAIFRREGHLLRSRIAAGLLTLYLAGAAFGHFRSESLARDYLRKQGIEPESLAVFPEVLGAHRFRIAARVNDDYRILLVRPWSGTVETAGIQPTMDHSQEALIARAHPMAQKLEWFFQAPVWEATGNGVWKVFDLQFRSAVIPRGDLFTYWFVVHQSVAEYLGRKEPATPE